MSTYSTARSIAGFVIAISALTIASGVLGAVSIFALEAKLELPTCIYLIIGGVALMGFGRLIDLVADVAENIAKIAERDKT